MSLASDKNKILLLQDRAAMLKKTRLFFDERGFIEVDCPLLSHFAPIDLHIDLFSIDITPSKKGYLHSSPEYGMKRLLSMGIGDIYQLSHVYRKEEQGAYHNPEFTLIEWYRINTSYEVFLKETLDLLSLFLGEKESETFSYKEAFSTYFALDFEKATIKDLIKEAEKHNLHLEEDTKEELLNLIWGSLIEPHLGRNKFTIITDYPPFQAALAQVTLKEGKEIAERFEIYFEGKELGNGYHELREAEEQKRRLEKTNQMRKELGKDLLPIDPHFLNALEKGFPDSYGIAVGFDRLMMLRHNVATIEQVLPISWREA